MNRKKQTTQWTGCNRLRPVQSYNRRNVCIMLLTQQHLIENEHSPTRQYVAAKWIKTLVQWQLRLFEVIFSIENVEFSVIIYWFILYKISVPMIISNTLQWITYRSVVLTLPVRSENSLISLDRKSSSRRSPCFAAANISSYIANVNDIEIHSRSWKKMSKN